MLEGARCVRRWGTLKGLAYIATHGPQNSDGRATQLDEPGTLCVHPLAIVHQYDCEEVPWLAHLS